MFAGRVSRGRELQQLSEAGEREELLHMVGPVDDLQTRRRAGDAVESQDRSQAAVCEAAAAVARSSSPTSLIITDRS
jgi:hypothetical protein